jgi:hypothetical protein
LAATASTLVAQSGSSGNKSGWSPDSSPDWMWRMDRPTGCLAAIPSDRMHNVPVYLVSDMEAGTDSLLTLQAELMAEDVATVMHASLDKGPASMPNVDARMSWYAVPAQLVVIARRDGSATARAKGTGGDSTALRWLASAFDSARAHGTALMIWPEKMEADSLIVRLSLMPQYVGPRDPPGTPVRRERKFGAFYLSEPDFIPALPKEGGSMPRYPSRNERNRVEGEVLTEFLVDSAGRADASTIRELWPKNKPYPAGFSTAEHEAFVGSVVEWEMHLARFEPARVGGCAVKQIVQLPIKFVAP